MSERWVDGVQLSPALSVLHWRRVRKCLFRASALRHKMFIFGVFAVGLFGQVVRPSLEHSQEDLDRIRLLVEQGALPRSALDDATANVADAQDQIALSDTLYNSEKYQSMTPAEIEAMLAAAARRLDRAQKKLDARQNLLEMGIISQAEMASVRNEVASRRLILDLAQSRVKLLNDLKQIVADEKRMEMHTLQNSMIRYDGKANFELKNLVGIERAFKDHFHHDLPVSALGQTVLHQSMGLDHSNKVDVALNPDFPEGLWLRAYLEKLHFSYLAFRSAVVGAATAPHIHIGSGSSRLHS